MKKKITFLILITLLIVAATLNKEYYSLHQENLQQAASYLDITQTFAIDVNRSIIHWKGKKTLGKHTGTIALEKGIIEVKNGKIIKGSFIVDMQSIKNEDIEDPEMKQKLLGHLYSEDFFHIAKYPKALFMLTSVIQREGKKKYWIKGDLTIKGIKNEIHFPARIDLFEKKIEAESHFKIDRTLWNIHFGSGSFYDNLGDAMISDEIELTVKLLGKPLAFTSN